MANLLRISDKYRRLIAVLGFQISVALLSQVRMWGVIGTIAVSRMLGKADYFKDRPVVIALLRLVLFSIAKTLHKTGLMRMTKMQTKSIMNPVEPDRTPFAPESRQDIDDLDDARAANVQRSQELDPDETLPLESMDLKIHTAVVMIFAGYAAVGWQEFMRSRLTATFVSSAFFSILADHGWQLIAVYRLRQRTREIAPICDKSSQELMAIYKRSPTQRRVRRGQVAPAAPESSSNMLRQTVGSAESQRPNPDRTGKVGTEESVITGRPSKFELDSKILRRRFRRLAAILRYEACASIVSIVVAYSFTAMFISMQPDYTQCEGTLYIGFYDRSMRTLLALSTQIVSYSCFFLFLKHFSAVPISFSKKVRTTYVQGILGPGLFICAIQMISLSFERGLVTGIHCSPGLLKW
ncbi:hypothetical protein HK105_200253 [Polyrhizophydium stewartii]|uniref:Uncharacterized protein n=1 Tax=Polyrhizophydium stewartii TaxID=2732419 RepID=A0ABR4NKX6_9FUNG